MIDAWGTGEVDENGDDILNNVIVYVNGFQEAAFDKSLTKWWNYENPECDSGYDETESWQEELD